MPSESNPATFGIPRAAYGLAAILAAAFALRVERLGLMAFEMDEGAACLFAARFVKEGLWPLVGVKTSLQFYNSPLFLYVLSPAFLVTGNTAAGPLVAAVMFALFGTVAVYFVYRTGSEFFSPAVGLLAVAMMALSPAAVEYSRRLWGHSLVAALCPIAFYFAMRWVVAGRPKAVFWLALIVAAAQQFHFSGALLWINLLILLALFRPKTDWPAFGLGLALGLLGYLPLLIEEADTGFPSFRIIWEATAGGAAEATRFDLRTVAFWFFGATDFGHNNFLQEEYTTFLRQPALFGYAITRALLGAAWSAALIGCGGWAARELRGDGLWRKLAEGGGARPILILVWAAVPLMAFLLLRVRVVAPYLLVIYPAVFLAIAWAAIGLWGWLGRSAGRRRAAKVARLVLVMLFSAWGAHQVAFHVVLRHKLAREGGGAGSYATYRVQREAMRFVALHAPREPVAVTVDDRPPDSGIDLRYWFLLWAHDENMRRFFSAGRADLTFWYVIRNTRYTARAPGFDVFLSRYRHRDFGILRVYVIPRPGPWPPFPS